MKSSLLALAILTVRTYGATPPVAAHQSGGAEHIVIIDRDAPIQPHVAEVLERLALSEAHPDVRLVFNNSAFRGFAASMKSHCLDLLANMSDISVVEEATSIGRQLVIPRQVSPNYGTRPHVPWGLQRISSTSSTVKGKAQSMDYTYTYPVAPNGQDLGAGADIYILDTGIYTQHQAFQSNPNRQVQMAWTYNGDFSDVDGHGTHVAGTAGGAMVGVASNANVFGVKALDSEGGGWSSNVIAGIDYIIQSHDARMAGGNTLGSVMSMSLASAEPVQAISSAIDAAVQAGIHTVVAAGNSNKDACSASPAASGGLQGPAITVGAVGMTGKRSSFSNYGDCVDVYAPGEDIISAWPGGKEMVNSLSGTSMATPHVTGVVAGLIGGNATLAGSPGEMKEWIRMMALAQGDGKGGMMSVVSNGVKAEFEEGMIGI
ncbi:hypothetical protein LTS10_010124 [Elasticomyces elasticus]|nr:hypothetical protein LTS10_010124 [Elasticomyces elasticus]